MANRITSRAMRLAWRASPGGAADAGKFSPLGVASASNRVGRSLRWRRRCGGGRWAGAHPSRPGSRTSTGPARSYRWRPSSEKISRSSRWASGTSNRRQTAQACAQSIRQCAAGPAQQIRFGSRPRRPRGRPCRPCCRSCRRWWSGADRASRSRRCMHTQCHRLDTA